ncbi:hypothetical protein GYB22_12710 [bacterium]|nr:hypothetical protein [bacterium]
MEKSSKTIKEEYIQVLGHEFGSVMYHINIEVIKLVAAWEDFKVLYTSGNYTIDLMNATAPQFFGQLQNILFRNIVLSISRLTENKKTAGYKNISFRKCLDYCTSSDNTEHSEHSRSLLSRIEEIEIDLPEIRKWRNKVYGHNSFDLFITGNVVLGKIDKELIDRLIELISTLFNDMHFTFLRKTVRMDRGLNSGSLGLLYTLEYGKRYHDLHLAEIQGRDLAIDIETPQIDIINERIKNNEL